MTRDISAVIVNWNSGSMLSSAVTALLKTTEVQVIVVDNGSNDGSLHDIESRTVSGRCRVRVLRLSENAGFAGGVNRGVRASSTPFALILNPDVRARAGAVEQLRAVIADRPRAGAVGGFVNAHYLPRRFPTAWTLTIENLGAGRMVSPTRIPPAAVQVDQPAAAALLVRREAFDEAGGFDESFFPAWYEDVAFARRLSDLGWERWFEPRAEFDHEGGYSANNLGIERFVEAYYSSQFHYARTRISPTTVPWLKCALAAGTIGRMIARPGLAAGYWRGLKRALSH